LKEQHLVFFDAECSLCRNSVAFLKKIDTSQKLLFSPLSAELAERFLQKDLSSLKNANTLVLLENYTTTPRVWVKGRAVFRIFWLLGGKWKLLGGLCFCPIGVDWIYDLIARHRHRL
jgi:predicted DCC family thiol-disulfide oxidoreductase YuxK